MNKFFLSEVKEYEIATHVKKFSLTLLFRRTIGSDYSIKSIVFHVILLILEHQSADVQVLFTTTMSIW